MGRSSSIPKPAIIILITIIVFPLLFNVEIVGAESKIDSALSKYIEEQSAQNKLSTLSVNKRGEPTEVQAMKRYMAEGI